MNDAKCPYCNSSLPVLAAPPTVEKQACPLCGEMVLSARWQVASNLATAVSPGEPPPAKPSTIPATSTRPPGIRKTLYIVLGIMVTMAIIGLSYALWTTRLRQSRHPWLHTKLEPIAFRKTLDLPGLAYLPPECVFVAGLHIGETVEDAKVGQPFLAEPRPTGLDWALKQINRMTGMKAEELDHVVIGGPDLARILMVVKARRKISLEKIADARPKQSFLYRDQAAYEFALQAGGDAIVWQADDLTLVVAMRFLAGPDITGEEFLKQVNPKVRPVEEVVPTELRSMIEQRLPRHNFAWLAADSTKLGFLGTLLAAGAERSRLPIAGTKRVVLGIAPMDGLTIISNLQADDAKAASKIAATLEKAKLPDGITRKVEMTPPDQPQHWVTLQLRGEVSAVRGWLGSGKDAKR